jgi:type III restriction enzyme
VKLSLKDFQEAAVDDLASLAARARADIREGGPQTLILAAPTGSGKTVIATRWIERLIEGDGERAPDPDATFLWITDQPELNEQTRKKILDSSMRLSKRELITLDANFDEPVFPPGNVYFLNTQKLGREKQLVRKGEKRTTTIWQTINNTAEQRPESFWVVIDEAHRGMAEDKAARSEASTIVQKFIKGSNGEVKPVPLLLGISATPERFAELLAATPRTNRPPVTVDPEEVRLSGLLKEAITLYHPESVQPSDLTLLRDAGRLLSRYDEDWDGYTKREKTPAVHPVLVVQVEDATKTSPTKTDVAGALATLDGILGPLGDQQVAHAFQEGHALSFGDRSVRYLAPSDIQDDEDVRVVLFKQSLTTGWDCPRAEVMMSFRRAVDKTVIAQLVGRMVRTPLARAVSGSDFLNTVSLYLPYYNNKALNEVIDYLSKPDAQAGIPMRVQKGADLEVLKRNAKTKAAFEAAQSLPTVRVTRATKQSNVRRLLKLGRLLAWDKLDPDAPKNLVAALVAALVDEHKRVAKTKAFKERVDQAAVIDVRAVTVGYGEKTPTSEHMTALTAVPENVDHAFAECGRLLGGGLHAAYLNAVADDKKAPPVSRIKLELYALLQNPEVIERVEADAGKVLRDTDQKYRVAIRKLPDDHRSLYREVRRQAARPEAEDWDLRDSIEVAKDDSQAREKHLYSRPDGSFSCKLNAWEEKVLDEALAERGVAGWLRNDPRKEWSFSVAYEKGGEARPMYPDLLVFRRDGPGILCDIYEPHSLAYEDSVAKAKGLAEFARDHGDKFGRIQLIAELKKGTFKRLRLDEMDIRDKVLAVDGADHLLELFG